MAASTAKQNNNFARLSNLIVNICTDVLREVLRKRHANSPASFQNALRNYSSTLRKELSTYQEKKLYTSKGLYQGDFADFDISLLYTLLRNTGNIKPHINGWGCIPQDDDQSLSANIERIRLAKNETYSHLSSTSINDSKFKEIWDTLCNAVCSIEIELFSDQKFSTRLEELRNENLEADITNQSIKKLQELYNEDNKLIKHLQDDIAALVGRVNEQIFQRGISRTEVLYHRERYYVQTRAMQEGINKMKAFGISIFTGREGSGKSTHALELLADIKDGKIFGRKFAVCHPSSVDQWEQLIDTSENTVIFFDDPLGTLNTNETLIYNDGGLFRKIWSCVQMGNVKLIMAIRSNIIRRNSAALEKHELFKECHIIDLSLGEFQLNEIEKKQIVEKFCTLNHITIVKKDRDENIYSKDILNPSVSIKISEKCIGDITASNPLLGFPLCCKLFFSNRNYIRNGLKFFSQPSKLVMEEIENLAIAEDEIERRQFVLLFYLMLEDGEIDLNNINTYQLQTLARTFRVGELNRISLRQSLKQLDEKLILNKQGDENKFIFMHSSILEAVCLTVGVFRNELPRVIECCDRQILAELIRTADHEISDNEKVIQLDRKHNETLAKRFIKEIRENRCGQMLSHPAFDDHIFMPTFATELGHNRNRDITGCQGRQGYSLFNSSCLYNKSTVVDCMMKTNRVPKEVFSDGFDIAVQFQNVETVAVLLKYATGRQILIKFFDLCYEVSTLPKTLNVFLNGQYLSSSEVGKGLILACRKGKRENIEAIFKRRMPVSVIAESLLVACKYDNKEAVRLILMRQDLSVEKITAGFFAACKNGNTDTVKLLIRCRKDMATKTLTNGVLRACRQGKLDVIKVILEERYDISLSEVSDVLTDLFMNNHKVSFETNLLDIFKTVHRLKSNLSVRCWRDILQCACVKGHSDIVRFILNETHTFSHEQVIVAFVIAASNGNSETLRVISPKMPLSFDTSPVKTDGFINACHGNYSVAVDIILGFTTRMPFEKIIKGLQWACMKGYDEMVSVILKSKPDIHQQYVTDCLTKAGEYGYHNVEDLIVRLRPDVAIEKVEHAFIKACASNNQDTVEIIMEARCDMLAEQISIGLSNASAGGYNKIIEYITRDRKFKISVPHLVAALFKACKFNRADTIGAILHTEVNVPLENIEMALRAVRFRGFYECENEIVKNRPEIGTVEDILHAFVQACCRGYSQTVDVLLKNKPNLSNTEISFGLLSACVCDHDTIVNLIMNRRKDDIEENQLSAFFIKSCAYGNWKTAETIMHHQTLNRSTVERGLEEARACGRNDIVNLIFKERQDLHPNLLMEAFIKASSLCQVDLLNSLLNRRKDLPCNVIATGFLIACKGCHEAIVRNILSERPDLTPDDVSQGMIAASARGNTEILENIIVQRKDIPSTEIYNGLIKACFYGHKINVEVILKERFDLSCDQIERALNAARESGFHDIEDMITEYRMDISLEKISSTFIKLCTVGKYEIVEKIIIKRRDISSETVYTGLFNACASGQEGVVNVISQNRNDLSSVQVTRCLIKSCRLGHHQIVKLLLKWTTISPEHITDSYNFSCMYATPNVVSEILTQKPELELEIVRKGLSKAYLAGHHDIIDAIIRSRFEVASLEPILSLQNSYEHGYCLATKMLLEKPGLLSQEQIAHAFVKACSTGYSDIVHLFLQLYPTIPNEQIADGLFNACACGHKENVGIILRQREDLQPEQIRLGIEKAYKCGNTSLVDFILSIRKDLYMN